MKINFYLMAALSVLMLSCSDASNDDLPEVKEVVKEDEVVVVPEKKCQIVNKDGLLIIEGESFALKGQWRIKEDAKASAGKYIEYYGSNSYNAPNSASEISVKFYVDKAATYLVRWYMRQPDEAAGDLSNDVWIYFPGDIGLAKRDGIDVTLTKFEKFVSRGKVDFTYGGALDLHNPTTSSWMRVKFPAAGEYTLKISGRSSLFQLDKLVLSSGISDTDAQTNSKERTEALKCE
ncbi:hypothetical protein [Flavobacterium sp. UMI-01]|uniref:hypothetical protein n=1 Tax=Flavobacterium sp. UMI-01 TaxID=1441053 RepID=UPI001C7DD151|nr:hypothetical protein [Flavobacterium sp. UMI-01]GIZ09666.1 hypothetical protein FUMI01_23930 [Flavobacterium sp. UMI-01]